METLKRLIEESQFEEIGLFDTDKLVARQDIRDMCAADKCQEYGQSWSCPPACGSLKEFQELFGRYTNGYVFQTIAQQEDAFDFGAIESAQQEHLRRFNALVDKVNATGEDVLLLSAGTCTLCAKCTYPDMPCVHPDKVYPSMEACGLLVSEVCTFADIAYYHGPCTVTFVSCALYSS